MNKLKTNRSRLLNFSILSVAMLFGINDLQAQQVDFSGTYTRNTDKCDPGRFSINSIPVQILVRQNADRIEIRRISKNYKGDTTDYTEQIKFNGTLATSVIRSNLNKKASIQWSTDQKGFTETAIYSDDQGNSNGDAKETWLFDGDGKALKIQLTFIRNGQELGLTEIFDKK